MTVICFCCQQTSREGKDGHFDRALNPDHQKDMRLLLSNGPGDPQGHLSNCCLNLVSAQAQEVSGSVQLSYLSHVVQWRYCWWGEIWMNSREGRWWMSVSGLRLAAASRSQSILLTFLFWDSPGKGNNQNPGGAFPDKLNSLCETRGNSGTRGEI